MAERAEVIKSVSRGMETISISGGHRTEVAAARAREKSATRAERSWRVVGDAIRSEMHKHPNPR
jgi:hypothetical protein